MMNNTSFHKEQLTVSCDTAELDRIRLFVEGQAQAAGFDSQVVYYIALAVDEACSNLIRHGYKFDKEQPIQVETAVSESLFQVAVRDKAITFDPRSIASPDMEEYLRKFKSGGLGIHIIRTVMDEMQYIPAHGDDSFNTLLLSKKRPV